VSRGCRNRAGKRLGRVPAFDGNRGARVTAAEGGLGLRHFGAGELRKVEEAEEAEEADAEFGG